MGKIEIQYIETDKLIPYASNPRNNAGAVDAVAGSIKEFGFKNPIIVDSNNTIIAGHTRLLAARKLGLETVPIIVANDLTEKQVKAFRIADNKASEMSEWDEELLALELSDLSGMFTGFDEKELSDLFNTKQEVVEDEYDIVPPEEPKSKLGDIYQLGRYRLMCGDATLSEDVRTLTNGVRVDMYLTDPPYNVNYNGKTNEALKILNDSMLDNEFRSFLAKSYSAANEVMKSGAVFYIWHADTEGYNFRGACRDIGWQVRQCLIWNKNSLVLGRQDYHWKHEPCLYGWKEGESHLWSTDRKQTTVLNFDKPIKNIEHPTMKPVRLFDYLIQNNTKSEDVVLDTFAGSGTTIIACEQNGRIAYCMELDPKYVDVIIDRWEKLTGLKAILLENKRGVKGGKKQI